ncbi:hypothetical protein [Aphanothece sacrum]|uniref:Uncharacterized protein n=1 Tax=Aphanothece sacrum FPU1 TaxID=1920663 RepID=A0A401IM68_APHSA|nr:hypothetical protein [Aphanothece sacrum]GBF82352.1 hypothetical protein AsFPU1_3780 [Aphanothece sacrum FPU1]GBF84252.1 hypothetical protein AsFPU3_1299 [Aphanothece sacrum FPU3]
MNPINISNLSELTTDHLPINDDQPLIDILEVSKPMIEDETLNIQEEPDNIIPVWVKNWLNPLITPWGIGSFALLLLTNLMIVGGQLWQAKQLNIAQKSSQINTSVVSPQKPTITSSLNLARSHSQTFFLDSLSILTPQYSSTKVANSSVGVNVPNTVYRTQTPLSLSQALLPPSLQPQLIPSYSMSEVPISIPIPPKVQTPSKIAMPIAPPTVPIPSVKPIGIEPPPPPPSVSNISPDDKVRQSIQQQLRQEEANGSTIPLGFNQKTRLEMQNQQNKVTPALLPRQINRLEKLQEREVLDSVNNGRSNN